MYKDFDPLLFYTATNLNWLPLLKENYAKEVILDSLKYLSENKYCHIYTFVIMPNHLHLILKLRNIGISDFQSMFLKYTGYKCISKMRHRNPELLIKILSTQNDRHFHFWERRSKWSYLYSELDVLNVMNYIHNNPVKSSKVVCRRSEKYFWSSALSYQTRISRFDFLELLPLDDYYMI